MNNTKRMTRLEQLEILSEIEIAEQYYEGDELLGKIREIILKHKERGQEEQTV